MNSDNSRLSTIAGGAPHAYRHAGGNGIDDGLLLELRYRAIAAKGAAYCMSIFIMPFVFMGEMMDEARF